MIRKREHCGEEKECIPMSVLHSLDVEEVDVVDVVSDFGPMRARISKMREDSTKEELQSPRVRLRSSSTNVIRSIGLRTQKILAIALEK